MRSTPDDGPSAELNVRQLEGAGEGLVGRIANLSDELAKRRESCEGARTVPAANIDSIRSAGLLRAYTPARYGGAEESLTDVTQSIRLIARVCPSTAWVASILTVHSHVLGFFEKELQDAYWSDGPDTIASSSVAPINTAKTAEGGLYLDGRFSYSSGCDFAQWAILGFRAATPDSASGNLLPYLGVVPRGDFSIEDTWHVLGLRGTGSKDLVLQGVLVARERVKPFAALGPRSDMTSSRHGGWLWNIPWAMVFGTAIPPILLGIADAVFDMFAARVAGRARQLGTSDPSHLARLAESQHDLLALSLTWTNLMERIEHLGRTGSIASDGTQAEWSALMCYVARRAGRAIDRLVEAAGTAALRDSNPMQQFWRDAHMALSHAGLDYDRAAQVHGRTIVESRLST